MTNKTTKYLGIDWGEKRIGLSLADNELKIATPFKTVSSLNELLLVVEDEDIDELILGVHTERQLDKYFNTEKYHDVAAELREKTGKRVITVDEVMSSKLADHLKIAKNGASRDELAATVILQSFLDGSSD